jgi:hypothetical protein
MMDPALSDIIMKMNTRILDTDLSGYETIPYDYLKVMKLQVGMEEPESSGDRTFNLLDVLE